MVMLSGADHDRLHKAIAEAERLSDGEVFCVLAEQSGAYREVPLAWAATVALLAPPLALLAGVRPFAVVALLQNGWTIAQDSAAHAAVMTTLIIYAAVQAVLFVAVMALASWAPVRRALTPGSMKRRQVHMKALAQFAHRLHASKAVTGILIYASLAERRVEVVADEQIHAKVPAGEWDRAVKAAVGPIGKGHVADGLIAAIGLCGAALARHFPRQAGTDHAEDNDYVVEV
jgi:putative membrane protein